jgi:pimeloyl-ACP methyl ester carboxylesterase
MSTSERIVKANGVELCVESFGDPTDPAVLLIHGAGHSLLAWDEEFVRRLVAGGRQVIRYDSRDAGRSTAYPAGSPAYGLCDLVADAAALLDVLGITAAHVVGMSQGAAVAQLLALDHADRVASLALASSTPGDIAAQLTNPFMIDAGEPWRGRLGEICAPTLVLHGTEDPLFPIGHGRALAAEITGARFIPLEQTGHEVFPRYQWDIVIPAILDHTAGR